jgi:hypothetical protein
MDDSESNADSHRSDINLSEA